eukprot:GHVR01121439.1.p1 GENE.GHVR01121439.1~~GHVR01121439.1.p1  ORF type:complete len:176 (+),score=12.26 GHVR01121439.1:43-570(+)
MFFIKVLIVIGVVSANDICAPPPIPKLPLLDGWWHYDTYNTSLYHNNTTHNNTTHNNTTHNNTTQALCIQIAAYRLCEGILVLSESAPIICTSLASHHSPILNIGSTLGEGLVVYRVVEDVWVCSMSVEVSHTGSTLVDLKGVLRQPCESSIGVPSIAFERRLQDDIGLPCNPHK